MTTLQAIHSVAYEELSKALTLRPVMLKYPFPERPLRTAGLIRLDGEVFTTDRLLRIVLMRLTLPVYITVYSTFIRPRLEYDLPVLSCETVCLGSKRIFLLDVHRTGSLNEKPNDAPFFDRLVQIRDRYPALLACQKKAAGEEIQKVFSRAVCQVRITKGLDGMALDIFREYLGAYATLVSGSAALAGEALEQARKEFESYLQTIVDHDPGVKFNKILFGKQGGVTRALDVYFGM